MLAVVASGVPLALSLSARVNAEVRSQAQGQADTVAATAADLLSVARRPTLVAEARGAAGSVRGRVIIVDRRGIVLADSAGGSLVGSSYRARPEVASALAGHPVQVQRDSHTLGQSILATAAPIIRGGTTIGAVRITQSVAAVHDAVRRAVLGLGFIGLIVLALGLSAGAVIAGQIARPLRRLDTVARRIAAGDLTARAVVEGSREQRSLSASFNEMADRVSRLVEVQRDFVADASHQLRTPLTGLRLRLEEAQAAGVSDDAANELRAGSAEVDRLAQIVGELMLLSRAGERELPGEHVDPAAVVEDAVRRWRPTAAQRDIVLEHEVSGTRTTVWCAHADLERALDALVDNALRYSPAGSRVLLVANGGNVEVLDEGGGIDPDERELVFERFHRGRAGRDGPSGTGLGLPIARELAREWGGEVTLANRPGGGLAARIALDGERGRVALPALNRRRTTVLE